ncbi:hypothetical protein C0989_004651 [Termitomyces sp. Mn162]|nr:hypothetical protein C0989_004651 [Termitomyces sp. Mn162]
MCTPAIPTPKKKKGKKKAKGEWDSDDEDESDDPPFTPGIMKPDITFFGEKLTDEFDNALAEDREHVDLLLIIGTSLKVSPVAEILSHLPHSVPQILINKTPIRHINPDVRPSLLRISLTNLTAKIVLLGNADDIVQYLCDALGWELTPPLVLADASLKSNEEPHNIDETSDFNSNSKICEPERVGDSHVWLFEGAEGGRWLEELKRELAAQTTPSLAPLKVDSGPITRLPSPMPATASDSTSRKREFDDMNGEQRVSKKPKS